MTEREERRREDRKTQGGKFFEVMQQFQRLRETGRQEFLCGSKGQLIRWKQKGLTGRKLLNKVKEEGNGEWKEIRGRR